MPANTTPIYTATPDVQWTAAALATGNTTKDGTAGTTLVFTAGANGSFLHKLVLKPTGTNVASLVRVFLNNGLTNGTAANNSLVADAGLPATTNSEVAGNVVVEVPLNYAVPAGYRVYAVLATTVAAGWQVTAVGGDY